MILGVDVSHWQTSIDWTVLKQNGVEFAIIKASQGDYYLDASCKKHVQGAQEAGMLTGLYHWCDPIVKSDAQCVAFLKASRDLAFNFVALDVEQHWADWGEWKKGKIKKTLSPTMISNNVREIAMYLKEKLGKPVIIYTRTSFINQYAKPALAWLNQFPLWLAYYPYKQTRVKTDWDTFKDSYKPTIKSPTLPKGCENWLIWQFTGDKFVLPGVTTALDINYYNGTIDEMKAWAGLEPKPPEKDEEIPPEVILTIEERVVKLELEARNHGWSV